MAGGRRCTTDSGRPSSASSRGSAASWEGGDDDFYSQMDDNGIIGLNQAVEEGDRGEEEEGSPISRRDPLEDQSFHPSDLQDSLSPGEESHALLLCDLDEQGSDSWVSEEDEGSWLIHRLPKRDRQLDMTEDERGEEEEEESLRGTSDPEVLSDSLHPDAVGPRDRQHRTEVPDLRQGEGGEVSPVEHWYSNHRGDGGEVSPAERSHGDHRGDRGEVSPAECSHGDYRGDGGEVSPAEHSHGDHRGDGGEVSPVKRSHGDHRGDRGEVSRAERSHGDYRGDGGEVSPAERSHGDYRGDGGEVSPAERSHGDHRGDGGEVSPAERSHGDHRGDGGEVSSAERSHGDHRSDGGEVSPAERSHGDHGGEEAAVLRISRDTQGKGHEGGSPEDTLTARLSSPSLHPTPSAGRLEPSLGGSATTLCLPRWTSSPGFESLVGLRCSPRSHAPTGGSLSESVGEGSWDTPVSRSLWPRQELALGNGEEEEEGAARSRPTSLSQRTAKRTNRHSRVPPSVVSPPPSDPAPYLRGHGTATGGSPKRGSPARYGKGLNYPLPDFSKVEPRVRFPKGGYRPPKSKGCPRRKGPAGEPPLVFKSPADIVREVLLSSADAPSLSPAPAGPPRPLDATVPQEFRSPQQASMLVHQLQEDYNRLLTKYAEAENTIDRLRLEAKVGLYSDPPEPSHPEHSGTLHMGSKVMTLTFPQAQRAEPDRSAARPEPEILDVDSSPTAPSAVANASPCSLPLSPRFGERLTEALSRQAGRFHTQVDSLEELLRAGRLKPFEQLKVLSCLAQGQGSLEKGYLGAREEHRLLQQQGRDTGPFDPQREVEGEIFRSGMRLEGLKEQVQPAAQVPPNPMALPSPPLGLDPTVGPPEATALTPRPESLLLPIGGEGRVLMGVAVSSASGESEGEDEMEGDKRLLSSPPWARCHRQQHGEGDLRDLPYHSLNFGGPSGLLDLGRGEGLPDLAAARSPLPGADGIAAGPRRTGGEEDGRTVVQPTPEEGALSSSPGDSQQEPLPRSPMFPRRRDQNVGRGRVKSCSSSPTSVGEHASSQGRASKPRVALVGRAPPQDGIVSPATDSGFVGSESSHLNLAAPGPAQQGATESRTSPLGVGGENTPPISAQPRPGSAPPGPTFPDRSKVVPGDPEIPPSGGQSRLATPPSPRLWPVSSSTSELDPETDRSISASEGEGEDQSVRHTQTANRRPRRHRSPAPADLHHYGDSFRVPGFGQLTNRHKAIQSLQADMSRLKEQLEGCLRRREPSCLITAPPLVPEDPLHSLHFKAPYSRFPQQQVDERREDEEGETEEEVEGRKEKARNKSSSPVPHLRAELDITSDAEYSQTTSKSQSSRRIPEASAVQWRGRRGEGRSESVTHKGPYTGQQYSLAVSGGRDEVVQRERRSHARPNRSPNNANGNSSRERAVGGAATAHSRPRPLLQASSRSRDQAEPGLSAHRTSGSTPQTGRPTGSTRRENRGVFLAAPPSPVLGSVSLVQCVPVYPSVLCYSAPISTASPTYPQPQHLSLDRGGGGACRLNHTLLADQRSLSSSMRRAIEAARHMRASSQRMARSLSTRPLHQGALSLS